MRRLGAGVVDSGLVRVRLLDAGMTMGILTLVFVGANGAVEVVAGNWTVVFGDKSGDESPPVSGEVTRGSGESDIVQPRSTKIH